MRKKEKGYKMTTPLDLEELKRLLAKATPGPWAVCRNEYAHDATGADLRSSGTGEYLVYGDGTYGFSEESDAALCAALRNASPEMIAEIEQHRNYLCKISAAANTTPGYEINVLRKFVFEASEENEQLRAEVEALQLRLFRLDEMSRPPCFVCGYDGPDYYQPTVHPCAAKHHAAIAQEKKS